MSQSRHYTISVKKQAYDTIRQDTPQSWLYIDDEKVDNKHEQEVFQMAQKSGYVFAFESCAGSIY